MYAMLLTFMVIFAEYAHILRIFLAELTVRALAAGDRKIPARFLRRLLVNLQETGFIGQLHDHLRVLCLVDVLDEGHGEFGEFFLGLRLPLLQG